MRAGLHAAVHSPLRAGPCKAAIQCTPAGSAPLRLTRAARRHTPQGVDQSPTDPSLYGKCTSAIEPGFMQSHWCKVGAIGKWPAEPTDKAKKCLKYGRATIYRGPIYGSSPNHLAACNQRLYGSDDAALVAVSTKYLKTFQGGWAPDKGACGQCMCVRMHGADEAFNTGLQKPMVKKHLGLTFAARVRARALGGGWVQHCAPRTPCVPARTPACFRSGTHPGMKALPMHACRTPTMPPPAPTPLPNTPGGRPLLRVRRRPH